MRGRRDLFSSLGPPVGGGLGNRTFLRPRPVPKRGVWYGVLLGSRIGAPHPSELVATAGKVMEGGVASFAPTVRGAPRVASPGAVPV